LIEKQCLCALCQRHGNPHALALTAGELIDGAFSEIGDAGGFQGFCNDVVVLLAPAPQDALVRSATASNQVCDHDAIGSNRGLRQKAELGCELTSRNVMDGLAIEDKFALGRV